MGAIYAGQLVTLEAANLFAGTTAPGDPHDTNHIRLTNVKLPGMVEEYLDHRPGGSPVGLEIDVMLNKLRCDFTLAGWSPRVASLIAAWSSDETQFWFFGVLRDRLNAFAYQAQANITGRLGVADPEQWGRGRVQAWNYSIRSIMEYELTIGGDNLWKWSLFNQNSLYVGM